MGNPISKLRNEIAQAGKEKEQKEEQLNILQKMLTEHLERAKQTMLNGERNDDEIHTGTVVEYIQQTSATIKTTPSPKLKSAIDDFFSGHLLEGFATIIEGGVEQVLGNTSIGQHESTNMFIMWTDNALLRLDGYYFRWNFASHEAITDTEGVTAVIAMIRVIDVTKTNPQVLTWAITRQANVLGKDADSMIDNAVSTLKKVTALEQAVHDIETKQAAEGIGARI